MMELGPRHLEISNRPPTLNASTIGGDLKVDLCMCESFGHVLINLGMFANVKNSGHILADVGWIYLRDITGFAFR